MPHSSLPHNKTSKIFNKLLCLPPPPSFFNLFASFLIYKFIPLTFLSFQKSKSTHFKICKTHKEKPKLFVFPWEDLLVVRRLIQTKGHGQRKKTTVLLLISKLTARAAGGHFLRPPVSSVAVRVAASAGLIISALILSVAISLNMKMTSSSNSIASLEIGIF